MRSFISSFRKRTPSDSASPPAPARTEGVSASASTAVKDPRTLPVSDFVSRAYKPSKTDETDEDNDSYIKPSFCEALAFDKRGLVLDGSHKQDSAFEAALDDEKGKLANYVKKHLFKSNPGIQALEDAKVQGKVMGSSSLLPEVDTTGSVTPNRLSNYDRDFLPLLAAQATGREIHVLEPQS